MCGIHFGLYMLLDGLLNVVLMFYPCFFHGFGTPIFLPRVFHVLASCSSILWVLFLVFLFVDFYRIKCTFLQKHTMHGIHFGLYMLLDGLLSVVLMFYPCFFHGFGTPTFLPRVFHVLASCSSILWVLFLVFIFVNFYRVKFTFLQNIVNYDAWHTCGSLPGALRLYGHPSPPCLGSAQDGGGPLFCKPEPLTPKPKPPNPKP